MEFSATVQVYHSCGCIGEVSLQYKPKESCTVSDVPLVPTIQASSAYMALSSTLKYKHPYL